MANTFGILVSKSLHGNMSKGFTGFQEIYRDMLAYEQSMLAMRSGRMTVMLLFVSADCCANRLANKEFVLS